MARIEYCDLEEVAPEVRAAIDTRPPLNIYRMLAHGGPSAVGFLGLGSALLRQSELDPKIRELVILRVGILNRAPYEVHQHTRIARHIGIPEEKIQALHDGPDAAAFSSEEQAILHYTDQVALNVKAGDTIFYKVAELLSRQEFVELNLTIGYYMMVSRFLENFEVDLEEEEPSINTFSSVGRREG